MNITSTATASRFATCRPGYRLLRCEDAALPFSVITATALLQVRRSMPPIEEFVLRSIENGVATQDGITELLGLDGDLVAKTLTRMWQADLIDTPGNSNGRGLTLTPRGRAAITELSVTLPQEQEIFFLFDRILLQPSSQRHLGLLSRRDAEERGYLLIRPANAKVVELQALKIREVNEALQAAAGSDLAELLVLKESLRQQLQFLPCNLLVFESDDSTKHAVEVVVDGRLEQELGVALEKLGLERHLGLRFEKSATENVAEIEPIKAFEQHLPEPPKRTVRQAVDLSLLIEVDKAEVAVNREPELVQAGAPQQSITGRPPEVEAVQIRNIDTFEHPDYLAEALATCERRLLIISPWVKSSVVDRHMLSDLRAVARRNVLIHVSFGDGREDQHDEDAVERLRRLADDYPNFVVADVGRTHGKVLIWDDNQIITSFNWLSFRGDRHRTYRQEVGTLVKNQPHLVDPFWREQFELAERVAGKQARLRS